MNSVNVRRSIAVAVGVVAISSMATTAFAVGTADAISQQAPKAITSPDSQYIELRAQQDDVQQQLVAALESANQDLTKAEKAYKKAVAAKKATAARAAAAARANAAASHTSTSTTKTTSHHEDDDEGDDD
jgi:hypothetical protein